MCFTDEEAEAQVTGASSHDQEMLEPELVPSSRTFLPSGFYTAPFRIGVWGVASLAFSANVCFSEPVYSVMFVISTFRFLPDKHCFLEK